MNKERRQNSEISQKISPTHKQTCFKRNNQMYIFLCNRNDGPYRPFFQP